MTLQEFELHLAFLGLKAKEQREAYDKANGKGGNTETLVSFKR